MKKLALFCILFYFVGCTSMHSLERAESNNRQPSAARVPFGLCTSGEASVALYKDRVEWKGIAEDSQLFEIFKQSAGTSPVIKIDNPAAPLYLFKTTQFLITYDYMSKFILCFGEQECNNKLLNRRNYSCISDPIGLQ